MTDAHESTPATPGADTIREIERLALDASEPIKLLEQTTQDGQPLAPLALVREGYCIQRLVDHLNPAPTATAKLEEVDSFIQYVNRYATADTLLSVSPSTAKFVAEFDYHAEPPEDRGSLTRAQRSQTHRPRSHGAQLQLIKSPELLDWEKVFKNWIHQEALAEWLEDHAHQVAIPVAADILTIARELSVTTDVSYKKAQRQADGGFDLLYKENTTGEAGELSVPGQIAIAIPLYLGDGATTVECILRYRLREGAAQFYIRPKKLEEMLRHALDQIRAKISEQTGHYIHVGTL
jgi:hypothetical protein